MVDAVGEQLGKAVPRHQDGSPRAAHECQLLALMHNNTYTVARLLQGL